MTAQKSRRLPSNSTATSASCSTSAARDAAAGKPKDVTAELLTDIVDLPGEEPCTMTDEEIVSPIRNWTVGELSTVSATVGVFVNFLARNRAEQDRLRILADGNALDDRSEIAPRRRGNHATRGHPRHQPSRHHPGHRTRRPHSPPAGSRVTINWASANRDEDAFEDALTYNPHRDQSRNLVYGDGIHVCPGAPLARLELRILLEELLRGTESIEIADEREARNRERRVPGLRLLGRARHLQLGCYRHRRCRSSGMNRMP